MAQGEHDKAQSLCNRALAINESAVGADHPSTIKSRLMKMFLDELASGFLSAPRRWRDRRR
ncbi:unnamed protein product, partial [Ectocarpus sp. 4 AP-2014]